MADIDLVRSLIADVEDFPKPGVTFKDITPLLASPQGFREAIDGLVEISPGEFDVVIGMEARGFMFAAPVAYRIGAGFVPVRKPGKLPRDVYSETFALEYGTETLTVHRDAVGPGARVLVIDDVLATGGTVAATAELVSQLGAELVHIAVVIELEALGGRATLAARGIENYSALLSL